MVRGYHYFIYVLDIKKNKIASAWYCPDEETAGRVAAIVDQKMEEEYGEVWYGFDFDCGIAETETCEDSHNKLEPRYEEEKRELLCKFGDFVLAATKTEQFLRTKKNVPRTCNTCIT